MNEYAIKILLNKIESNLQSQEKLELIIEILIEMGYDGLLTDHHGVTPIIYTVKYNYKELTESLLNHFKDIDMSDTIFSKPVHIEHTIGNSIFDEALCASSNLIKMVNKRDLDNKSALDYAVCKQYYDTACNLVLHGADINTLDIEEKKSLLLYSDEEAFRNASSIADHKLRPIVGLLAIKVPKAVVKYSSDYRYPRLLSYFCWHGHSKVVASLIDSIEDDSRKKLIINNADNSCTPLDRANNNTKLSDYDHLQIVKYLFQQGATNTCNNNDPIRMTLQSAAHQGHIETFKYFVQKADKKDFNTYIGLATIDYHINLIEYIWNNYRKYTVDRSGNTVLHYATWKGNVQSVKYLCENYGVDINCINQNGETPLDNAIEFEHIDVIRYLIIKYNAHVGLARNKTCYRNMHKLFSCIRDDINTTITSQMKNTLLYEAIESGDFLTTKHLMSLGVDINKPNMFGYTPLHLAVQNYDDNITKLLLQHGATYNTTTKTALHLSRILKIVDSLFQSKKLSQDLNATIDTETRYNDAYDANNPMIFLMNVKGNHGQTLLHKAVLLNDKDAIELILEYNQTYISIINNMNLSHIKYYVPIDISLQDAEGNTPLHLAAYNGNIEIVNILINENPDINIKNNLGHTPIFIAGKYGHKSIVKLLVNMTNQLQQSVKIESEQQSDNKDLTNKVSDDLKVEKNK